jgi:hypothetical protein
MGKLTVKKYESKEFTPQILEAPYLIYEKLFKKLEEQRKSWADNALRCNTGQSRIKAIAAQKHNRLLRQIIDRTLH